jgi:hypothetical protein
MKTKQTYEVVYGGYMSTIVKAEDGKSFTACKKELLEYLSDQIRDLKNSKLEIRAMKESDVC